jgi:ABC-type lipoprotein export system ATPase subunit
MESKVIIDCENIVKIYKTTDIEVVALQGLELTVEEGEIMAIIGNSGSGKSTLLNMIGGLDKPSAGRLTVADKDLFKLNRKEMLEYRRDTIGFVWQNNARNLIPYLSAKQNIETVIGLNKGKKHKFGAVELLDMVGMSHRKNNKLSELSGGEQQRIAIAIALCNNPKIVLADEPTGAVDKKTGTKILELFRELNKSLGVTVVIVTHDLQMSAHVNRVVAIRDGRTSSEFIRKISYNSALMEIGKGQEVAFGKDQTHDEFTVVDKTGRLQLPKEYLQALGLEGKGKVKLEMEEGKIVVVPAGN